MAAARLDGGAYRTIADDARFWPAAFAIVALGSLSHAILGVAWATEGGWAVITSVVPAAVSQVDMWLGISIVGWAAGRALGSKVPLGGMLRAVGVASLPAILYGAGEMIPPILLVMAVWWLAATVIAVRAALGMGLLRGVIALVPGVVAGYALAVTTTTGLAAQLR